MKSQKVKQSNLDVALRALDTAILMTRIFTNLFSLDSWVSLKLF